MLYKGICQLRTTVSSDMTLECALVYICSLLHHRLAKKFFLLICALILCNKLSQLLLRVCKSSSSFCGKDVGLLRQECGACTPGSSAESCDCRAPPLDPFAAQRNLSYNSISDCGQHVRHKYTKLNIKAYQVSA